MRLFITTLLALLFCTSSYAQKINVSGIVLERETGEPCISANVVLLNAKDSTQATGITTQSNGTFSLPSVKSGDYILRISYVGFKTHWQNLTLAKKRSKVDLGTIRLSEDARIMDEAVVSANAAMVEQREDTFVFNASAYRVPPGSTLETLVKKLPGADVDNDGKITVNGKEVKKILVKGKEFFSSDTKTAMQNIPIEMVDKIKAYDKQSDYSRMTGIDDGEEETVLDLTVKKGMDQGWMVTVDGGGGIGIYDSEPNSNGSTNKIERYSGRINVQRFTENSQMTMFAGSNNTGDRGGMGGGGGGRFQSSGGGGLRTTHEAGINFATENGKKEDEAGFLQIGGNARFRYNTSDTESKSNSETFLSGNNGSTFSNSRNSSLPWNWSFSTNYRFEWQIDSLTKMMFFPDFSYSRSHGETQNSSVTFRADPYEHWTDPLYDYDNNGIDSTIVVNDNQRMSMSDSHSTNVSGRLQLNRRIGKTKGRNLTFDVNAGYSNSASESWSKNLGHYYNDQQQFNNQHKYTDSPSSNWNVRGRISYTEPITQNLNLQLAYSLQYRFSDSDRSQYELDSLVKNNIITSADIESWVLGTLPTSRDQLEQYARDWENSQYATYREWNHEANVMLRYTDKSLNMSAGVSVQPQTTHMIYDKNQHHFDTARHVFNWTPRINMRYKISKTSQINLRYNGRMTQPSMTNLLDIYDTSDPLNISRGNSGLKPSFTHNARLFYNNYITSRQMGWMTHLNWSNTLNSTSNATIYDKNTGARYSRPENINGNWNAKFFGGFNTALDSAKAWNMHLFANVGYTNHVGYETTSAEIDPKWAGNLDHIFGMTSLSRSTTRQWETGGRLNFTYRNDWIEVGPQGSINYNRARNDIQPNGNMDTYTFGYGGNLQLTMPWGLTFTTDITQQGRRGYSDASMNTNELIWNAQFTQTFLRKNNLIVSLMAYDILHQRSSISRSLSATQRSDSWSKDVNTYLLLNVQYKLNLLGKHASKAQPERPFGPEGQRPPMGGGMRPMGPPERF